MLGSRDSAYQPSKLHTALYSGRQLIAVAWSGSHLASALRDLPDVWMLELGSDGRPISDSLDIMSGKLAGMLASVSAPAPAPGRPVPACHARRLTLLQCEFFESVLK